MLSLWQSSGAQSEAPLCGPRVWWDSVSKELGSVKWRKWCLACSLQVTITLTSSRDCGMWVWCGKERETNWAGDSDSQWEHNYEARQWFPISSFSEKISVHVLLFRLLMKKKIAHLHSWIFSNLQRKHLLPVQSPNIRKKASMTQREGSKNPTQVNVPRAIPVLGSWWLQTQQHFVEEKIKLQNDLVECKVRGWREEGRIPWSTAVRANPAEKDDRTAEVQTWTTYQWQWHCGGRQSPWKMCR